MPIYTLYTAMLLLGLGAPPPAPPGVQPAMLQTPQPFPLTRPNPAPPTPSPAPAATPPSTPPPAAAPAPPPAPALQIDTIGPATVNLGQPLRYEIVVRNVGQVGVLGVRVEDQLPAGARFISAQPLADVQGDRLSWTFGSLDAGGERHFTVEVQPADEGDIQSHATVTFSSAADFRAHITRPRLTLTKTGPENVLLDDPVTFQIQVTNNGSGPATGVLLHDQLPAGLKHPQGSVVEADIGKLAPGETRTVTLTATAVQLGRQVNEAVATADGGLQASAQAVVTVTQAGLELRKDGPSHRFLNREAEYDLVVHNPGTAPATNVRLVDALPEGLDFLSASDGGKFDPATRQVVWQLDTLAPGQRRGISVRLTAKVVGEWVNRSVVQADRGLEAKAEAKITIEGVAALMLEVVDLDDPVEVGAETTYEIRVVNQGTRACSGLQILATVPRQMEVIDANGPTAHRVQGQQVLFEKLPTLAARADALYRVKVRGLKPGDVRFRVQMSCDELTMPVYEEESTLIYADDR